MHRLCGQPFERRTVQYAVVFLGSEHSNHRVAAAGETCEEADECTPRCWLQEEPGELDIRRGAEPTVQDDVRLNCHLLRH